VIKKIAIIGAIVLTTLIAVLILNSKKEKTAWELMEESSKKPKIKREKTEKIKVTFIELGSVNCMPCKMMKPVMEKVEENYKNVEVVFYDVWTDEGRPYGEKYGVKVIPTQIFLDENGEEYYRHEGYFDYEALSKILVQKGGEKWMK
jgi:thioredoxin 1